MQVGYCAFFLGPSCPQEALPHKSVEWEEMASKQYECECALMSKHHLACKKLKVRLTQTDDSRGMPRNHAFLLSSAIKQHKLEP